MAVLGAPENEPNRRSRFWRSSSPRRKFWRGGAIVSHSTEPWSFDSNYIVGADEKRIACPASTLSRNDDENADNARRIVACVNACADIPTETLESCNFPMQLAGILALQQQRDDLLAALKVCADQFDAYAEHHRVKGADEKFHRNQLMAFNARAAIAKTRGAV